jgi:crotonobetainyl-CoA:carnitine CoA-transferase CaiB-like acyl-CoA transferase
MPGPLSSLKVVEMGTLIAGPYCARLLAEFGAEVVKVETPGEGDPLRKWRRLHEGTSLWWYVQARNKKSIAVNLRETDGQAVVRRLAAKADIVVENFRPGTMEKWGLGYEALSRENPGLVMVRISGFGQTGPYKERPGFGAIGESMGGMRYITGYPDRAPVRVGISIGDSLAAMFGVIGALSAIHHRQATGRGQVVDVALYEAVFAMMESMLPEYGLDGYVRERTGASLPGIVPSNTYPCRDGYVVIGANADSIFKRMMRAIGPRRRSRARGERWPSAAHRRVGCGNQRVDLIPAARRGIEGPRSGGGPFGAHLFHCRHHGGPPLPRARHDRAASPGRQGPPPSGNRAEIVRDARQDPLGGSEAGRAHRRDPRRRGLRRG